MTTPACRALIKQQEGLRLTAYRDGGGVWTIGYGHTGPDVHEGLVITPEQADDLFEQDFAHAVSLLNRNAPWWMQLCDVRQDVMVSMVFNLGWGNGASGLSGFHHFLAALRAGNYQIAADEMLMSKAATQAKSRYQQLSLMMRTGINQTVH